MKTMRLSVYILLFCILSSPNSFAQEYTQWALPEGAKMRLGKGVIYDGNIAFSPDSSLLAVASTIGVWLYDGHTGQERNLLTNNSNYVSSVEFSRDGNTLASCSGNEFYLWDVSTGNLKLTVSAHLKYLNMSKFHPNGNIIATCSGYYKDGTIKLWDVSTGRLITTIIGHENGVETIAFSPDGTFLVSVGEDEEVWSMKFWDVDTGELKTTIILEDSSNVFQPNIAFSPDGHTIAICGGWTNKTVQLWDVAATTLKTNLQGHTDSVNNIAFSLDSRTLASGSDDRTVILWDTATGSYKKTLIAHTDDIVSLAFSPDRNTLASASTDGTIVLWDAKNLLPRATITEHVTWIEEIDFSPDGRTIVSGGYDKLVRLWDTTSGKNINNFAGHIGAIESVAYSADGQTIASGSNWKDENFWYADDYTVRIWDVVSGTQESILFGHDRQVSFVDFSPDGRYLISLGGDERAILWDAATENPLWTIDIGKNQTSLAAFNPDNRTLAIRDGAKIRLFDITSKQQIATISGHSVGYGNIVFSPDGKTLTTVIAGNDVLLWDIATGEEKTIQTHHKGRYVPLSYSPDGKTLVTASTAESEPIRLWDPISLKLKHSLKGMLTGVYSLKFSSDGKTFATLGGGGTILLWDYADIIESIRIKADVNGDGVVDINDLIAVSTNFGQTGPNAADVNDDGIVDIADLLIVASAIGDAAAAPLAYNHNLESLPSKTDIQNWITKAQQLNLTDTTSQKGIRFLEQLLLALSPEKTNLLPNYPNPFNPETWMPYQLSEAADVSLQIYTSDGQLVRSIDIGHQPAGLYHSRGRAAYWNGKNEVGEPVASGVYFYKLSAGQYTATRKMLIRK